MTGLMAPIDQHAISISALAKQYREVVVRSALRQRRAYVIGQDEGGLYMGAPSVKRAIGGQVLETPDLVGGAVWLPNLGLREAKAVRAFAPVAVQASPAGDDEQTLPLFPRVPRS